MNDKAIFYPHGELHFSVEGNLMIMTGTGPWNMESIIKSGDDATRSHKKLYGLKWGLLALLNGQAIHTPDAANVLIEAVKKDKKNGRTASALVLYDSGSADFGKHHISEIYRKAGETFRFFDNEESARKWLSAQLD
ncbi:hypothetical protein [Spirochaeta isovalerica]|uniref:STAS/SEC14 domain-containing protein n=1 Tax=Spirochaeta isovalerica TaxID=150 RepID=A0A841R7F1_9SPIO|nr:hypothetical protein [Spirochaeta isovalerica]MBB6481184.1 hypothetical protein [Spirochaeta isovalerica]